jgi:hypothetical protein
MQTRPSATTALGHTLGMIAQAAVVLAIVAALAIAAATVAGRPPAGAGSALAGKAQTSWISLAQTSRTAAGAQLTLGSLVAFDAGYPNTVKNPRIEVLCYQAGALVYGEAGGVNDTFLLGGGGSIWLDNGGSADCVANLYYFGQHAGKQTYNRLASTTFSAS